MSRTRDPGLYCGQLAWLLCSSSAELGQRGTTAAVVSAIERGGAGGSGDPDLAMLLRCYELPLDKGKRPQTNVVARHRQLEARWRLVPLEHQQTLLAHYLASERADGKIRARFGKLAGVVLYRWLALNAQARELERKTLQAEAEAAAREPRALAVRLSSRVRAYRAARSLQELSLLWYLQRLEREAWAALGQLKRYEGALLDVGSVEADAKALALACTRGDPPPLEQDADQACRAAHAAWYDTRQQEAKRWADGEDEAPASRAS